MGSCAHHQLYAATTDVAVSLVAYLGAFRISCEELLKRTVWSVQLRLPPRLHFNVSEANKCCDNDA